MRRSEKNKKREKLNTGEKGGVKREANICAMEL